MTSLQKPPRDEKASPSVTFRTISANRFTHVIEIADDSGGSIIALVDRV